VVHEAYERMADLRTAPFRDRAHFFAVAARMMRHILADHARRRRAQRRGGPAEKVALDEDRTPGAAPDEVDVIALDEALDELATLDPGQAWVVELRFFAGLGPNEIAELTGVSRATVHRQWTMARAWLRMQLKGR
jgi:RNA polymerase sigma factor (TIGR02999 family)